MVPPVQFFFAATMNKTTFLELTQMPVDIPAGIAGLLMAVFGVRTLEVFDIELGRRLEVARRMKVLLDERDRIARELHDGIIQSLYVVGLSLESVKATLEKDTAKAQSDLQSAMERLDGAIQDMRVYIMDLKGYGEFNDLVDLLRALIDELSEEYSAHVELEAKPHDAGHLSDEERSHILQIVREAVSNAARHGNPKRIIVSIAQQDGLSLSINDDGCGFDVEQVNGQPNNANEQRVHHGIKNMERRAELIGGYLSVQSEQNKGTQVILTLPQRE